MPYHRRPGALVAALVLVLPAVCGAAEAPSARAERAAGMGDVERQIVRTVNRIRNRHGLPALRPTRALAVSAARHNADMLRHDFFAHHSSDGTPMVHRVRRHIAARRVGENLAALSPRARRQASRTVRGWLRSPSHRQVLLGRRFGRVGVAKARGRIGARSAVVFTLDVASRE